MGTDLKSVPKSWIAFLIDRPIAVFTVLLTTLVLGFIAYARIPVQLLPSGWGTEDISIWIPYPNANPYETLEKVTRLVEEEIESIPGVVRIRSNSSPDTASVHVEFSGSANMDLAYAEVRDRMERVRPRLPNGADRYFIWRFNMDETAPVVFGGLLFDLDSSDERANYLAEEVIRKRIESVDGVARMQIYGLLDQSVRILLDENRCREAKIDLYQLVTRLARDNFASPVGRIEDGELRYFIRVDSKTRTLEEIRDIPVTSQLRIGDIAEVKYVQSVRSELSRINGKFSLFAAISRNSGANIVEVCQRIDAAMRELEARNDLASFRFLEFFDQGQMIQGSLRNLGDSAVWGAVYAIAVLFVFLHRVRLTLMVALAIPLSILMTLVCQFLSGDSFNLCSMMGMTLGIGMLVDNAIVVVENVFRYRQKGISFREAAVRGTQEVALPVTLSTLTSIVVFLPLMFLSEQRNLRLAFTAIGVPLSVSLLASLAAALVFIPSAIYHLHGEKPSRTAALGARVPSLLPWLSRGIRGILRWTMRHRLAASGLALGILATMGIPAEKVQKSSGGDGGQHFHVEFDLPRNTSLSEASEVVKSFEDRIAERKKDLRYDDFSAEFDRLRADVTLWYNTAIAPDELRAEAKKVEEMLPKQAGVLPRVRTHLGGEGGGEERGGIRLLLTGRDYKRLASLGEEVKRRLEAIPEFSSVATALERGREEVRVEIDRDKASALALSPQMVSEVVAWGLRGFSLPRFQKEDWELPFLIQYSRGADESLNDLRDVKLLTPSQREVPLAAIASFSFDKSPGSIFRRDGKTVLSVRANTQEKDLAVIGSKVRAALASMEFPTGYGWFEEGGLQQWEEDAGEMWGAGILAIALVFLLMGVLFESAILPVSVLLTIPFALFGGFWLLFLSGTPLDLVGMIGFVILVGVVVNNGILLVDHINRLRKEGLERAAAIVQAVADRLRPVLMTALTTIVGLLPLAVSQVNPQEGISYQSLAVTVIGGLSVSTIFTLWVVPLCYTLVEDLRDNVGRAVRGVA